MPSIWVEECAWHPKYFGHRRYVFRVPIPPETTPHEFVQAAEAANAITHGICSECLPIMKAEIKATQYQHRQNRRKRVRR